VRAGDDNVRSVRYWIGLVAGALAACAVAPEARADDKTACIDANAGGQELRLKGRWRDAELALKKCARATCPDAIAQDCAQRYEELQSAMPTLLVAAKQPDGADTMDARLMIDGVTVATRLPPTAIEVDPGEHVIRVEHGAWLADEQRLVLLEGQKNRGVAFRFTEPPASATRNRTPRLLGLVLTGAGAVVTGIGATFIVLGLAERSDLLANPCANNLTCSPGDVDTVQRDYWIGGIAVGLGLAALGIGIWELVAKPAERPAVSVQPSGLQMSF
jgi:hypothetical protein